MKTYISESRAVYEDNYHGQFSKKLAAWAIDNMRMKDATGRLIPIKPTTPEAVIETLRLHNIRVDERMKYTAWYLFNMARADYQKTLTNDAQRSLFVQETLLDPDCCSEAVLECFTAKMCVMGVPIYWEDFL